MEAKIQSHIQMPKLLLKRFHNNSKFFYYYDVVNKYIGNHGSAGSINTELGYYSIDTEHYLRDNIETPFSNILTTIEKIDFDQESFSIDPHFREITLDFIFSLIARDPTVHQDISENSVHAQFLPTQFQHDFLAMLGADIGRKKGMFSDYILTFIVNKTDIPYVLSVCGIYSYSFGGHTCVNLPISPEVSLCLIHKDYSERLIHDNKISMFLVKDSQKVEIMNMAAFQTQEKRGWGYVVCPEKEELKRLAEISCNK